MKKQLDTAKEAFTLFKKISNYIKGNFVNVLQTILILAILLALYFGYRWVEKLLDNFPGSTYTVEETEETFQLDNIINSLLDDTLETYDADRARLVQFHNGTHSLGGIPFKYISTTHESVRAGVSSEILNYQNIPTSVLGAYAETMLTGSYVSIPDTTEIRNDSFKQLMEQQAIQARCMYPIIDNAGRFTGFIALDWVNRNMPHPLDGSCICEDLVKESNIVENVLFSN